jgi:hypothetical protein
MKLYKTSRLCGLRGFAAVFAFTGLAGLAAVSHAQTVIFSDSFSTVATPVNPASDGVNLIDAQWQTAYNTVSGTPYAIRTRGTANPQVFTTYNAAAFVSLEKADIKTSSALTISADIKMQAQAHDGGGISGGVSNGRGIGLGFFSAAPQASTETRRNFTGFVLDASGTLALISINDAKSPAADDVTKHATVAWQGTETFSLTTAYKLTYSIDMATGGVTSVILGNTDLTEHFKSVAGVFTTSTTVLSYAGFYASSGSSVSNSGEVDNFSLALTTSIPEPGTWTLIIGTLILSSVPGFRRLRAGSSR